MFGIGVRELVVIALIALFWAAMIVLIASVLRWVVSGGVRDATKKTETNAGDQTTRRILDERYTRGRISRDEYEQMRRDIAAD